MTSEHGETDLVANDIWQQAAQHTLAANPLVGVRGRDIADAARVLSRLEARAQPICGRREDGRA